MPVPGDGVNHIDYSADLSYFVASCEFSGKLLVVDRYTTKIIGVINLNGTRTSGSHERRRGHEHGWAQERPDARAGPTPRPGPV